jgi:hypothetical protein
LPDQPQRDVLIAGKGSDRQLAGLSTKVVVKVGRGSFRIGDLR